MRLLKSFQLAHDGRTVPLPVGSQRVLAFLALHGQPLQRVFVAGNLWLDSPEERANASLRTALWRLRLPGCTLVEATATQVALADEVEVDVVEQAARAERVLLDGSDDGADLLALCTAGDLLSDWYDDWVLMERERFRQLRLQALERLCEDFTAAGRIAEATQAGLAAVVAEPLRESAHRALVRAHVADGNIAEAIRQYRLCRHVLEHQLGLAPSERMEELVRSLPHSGAAAAATPFPF